eukprot:CAMPEP_0170500506 /NCGR_PEP_ID=MMETSP0208-20121228/35107_1 /TAXON_ID=197538 /ORGANISM="Strombidium inclinatum, Strain S3" /LENGTH=58 /DNA_ID=CAMNT_0010778583 /DNA_START=132 /DNA_END=308 /DNA_ORIENTATION=-
MKICFIADEKHRTEAIVNNIHVDLISIDKLKTFNKDKKIIKKWAKHYDKLIASESILR